MGLGLLLKRFERCHVGASRDPRRGAFRRSDEGRAVRVSARLRYGPPEGGAVVGRGSPNPSQDYLHVMRRARSLATLDSHHKLASSVPARRDRPLMAGSGFSLDAMGS